MNRVSWGDLRDGRGFLVEMLLIWKETVLSLPRLFFWKQSCTWAVSLDHSVDIRNAGLIRISVILLILNLTVWNSNQAIVNLAPSNVCLVLQLPVSIFDQNLGSRPKWRVIAALHSKEIEGTQVLSCPYWHCMCCKSHLSSMACWLLPWTKPASHLLVTSSNRISMTCATLSSGTQGTRG